MAKSTIENRTMIKGYQTMPAKFTNLGNQEKKLALHKGTINDKVTVHKAK